MAKQYKSLHPAKYYRDYLSHNIRPDGRDFDKFRPIILNVCSIDTADGSAIAKIGRTTVVCGIKAEFCKPKAETPREGFIVPNLELPPLCSPKFRPGPPSDQAQVLTQLIADIIENSECIDLKELCIFPDKLAWCLFIDFICLDFDGAVVDACVLSLMGALRTVRLPSVEYDPAIDNKLVNLEDRIPLHVRSNPISTTFIIFDDKIILADPTADEENLCSGIVTIVLNGDKLCCVHKPGGSALTEEELFDCVEKSKKRLPSIENLIEAALKNV
ncbi:exosome complex component RRP43-like [Anoplophora glabripennis]|uniref:exosome complex component RRP43-like n=1 Tax=Anoplophora glabripennis TaxID=217634 RepID=UPI000874EA1C|nr:exosome complex component RRP43-like [Anoplophora glabripennis]